MARTRRLWSPEHYDHVVIRGNNRQNIFGKAEDVFYWFQILDDIYLEHSFTVAAYCIMTNHVHLFIKEYITGDISKIMTKILSHYATWFNIIANVGTEYCESISQLCVEIKAWSGFSTGDSIRASFSDLFAGYKKVRKYVSFL